MIAEGQQITAHYGGELTAYLEHDEHIALQKLESTE